MNVFALSFAIEPNKNFFGVIGDRFGGVADRLDVCIRLYFGVD